VPPIDSAYQLLTKLLSPKRHAALTIQKKTDFIQSCSDAGDVLVRVGADLVRLKANGESETIEGFFDQAGLIDDYALSNEQVLRWRGALGLVISGGVEVAQAQTDPSPSCESTHQSSRRGPMNWEHPPSPHSSSLWHWLGLK